MFHKLKASVLAFLAFLGLMLGAASAQAALPTEVTTAITSAGDNLLTGATAVIVAMVAFWGMRKLGQKMGWW